MWENVEKARKGSLVDVIRIRKAWRNLGFTIIEPINGRKKSIQKIIEKDENKEIQLKNKKNNFAFIYFPQFVFVKWQGWITRKAIAWWFS